MRCSRVTSPGSPSFCESQTAFLYVLHGRDPLVILMGP